MDKINVELVKQLINEQFPIWSQLEIKPVELSGNDNRTFHLGDKMSVRLPSAECYVPQVEKEQKCAMIDVFRKEFQILMSLFWHPEIHHQV